MDLFESGIAAMTAYVLAIQQTVEWIDVVVFRTEASKLSPWRKAILRLVVLLLGFTAAASCTACGLLTIAIPDEPLRFLVTGFGLAGGTEAANSLLKFVKYTKEKKKAEAAQLQDATSGKFDLHPIQRQ